MTDLLERTHTMPDDARAIEAQLQCEDAGIERAAIALCWAGRPALATGSATPLKWWQLQNETTRRLHLYRARIAVTAWENDDGL